ncbi:MAG TPA: 2Fe-2S iron-sulfur cluster-binding protein [Acidimicrobiales bacterium]|jgi:phenol hydroxylase P5 protein|nr:2Fe-2S iron-sulfur cluster-binding protein [Acidimicrobiales bacterium]
MPGAFTVRVEPVGRELTCRGDQSLLDACLREGVWLPHACTHGTCGTCKAQILEGEVDHRDSSSFALLEMERVEGQALICTARPRSDVVIEGEVDVPEGVEMHPVRDLVATVAEVTEPARDVRVLRLDLDEDLSFNPGQYVQVDLPGADDTRSFSLANPPSEPRRLELHVKRTPGGLATDGWIFATLEVGARVGVTGPFGQFCFRPARTESMLLLAGGTGLAPIKSIVAHVLGSGLDREMTVYHGVATAADLYDWSWFEAAAAAHPDRLRFLPALSREDWNGRTGRIPDQLAADFERCAGHVAYVCGSPAFVDDTMKALMRKRLFPRDIAREDFYDLSDKVGAGVRSPLLKR